MRGIVITGFLLLSTFTLKALDRAAIRNASVILEVGIDQSDASNVSFSNKNKDTNLTFLASTSNVWIKPGMLSLASGTKITLMGPKANGLEIGENYIVCGVVVVAGKNVSLLVLDYEVAGTINPQELIRTKKALVTQKRVKDAKCVVLAKVNNAGSDAKRPNIEYEHDAYWNHYELQVEEVLFGTLSESPVKISVPSSDDALWADGPQLKQGATYIFYLQPIPGDIKYEIYNSEHITQPQQKNQIQRDVAYAENCSICDD